MRPFTTIVQIFTAALIFIMSTVVYQTGGGDCAHADMLVAAAAERAPVITDHKVVKRPARNLAIEREGRPHIQRLKPDLIIKSMKIHPPNPTTMDTIRFSAYVHNAGAVSAGASKAGIKIGGETFPVLYSRPAITAGSSSAMVRTKKINRPGTYWVKFIADAKNDVSEAHENNNMGSLKFTVVEPPPPDLTVTNITNNANNCLVYTIKNLGGPIPSGVNRNLIGLRFTKGGIIGYTTTNLNLMDPNCVLCQTNGTITATKCHPGQNSGPWFDCIQAKVEVDYTNKLTESDESNNTMEDDALNCGGPPWN